MHGRRDHHDDKHTHRHTENGEARAHLVGANGVDRNRHALERHLDPIDEAHSGHSWRRAATGSSSDARLAGIHAGDDSNTGADQHAHADGPGRNVGRHRCRVPDDRRRNRTERDAHPRAKRAQGRRLDEELHENVAPLGAECFADADLVGAFGHGDEHDVHDHDGTHHEADGGERDAGQHQIRFDLLPEGERRLRRLEGEVVVLPAVQLVSGAHHRLHLRHGRGHRFSGGHLDDQAIDDVRLSVQQAVHGRAKRGEDVVVERHAEGAAARFADADHGVGFSAHLHLTVDGADGGEEALLQVRADDDDARARHELFRRESPARW